MFAFIFKILITGASLFISAKLLSGVEIKSFSVAIFAAILLLLLNMTLNPILQLFALPVTILTLGLFALIVNAFVVYIVSKMMDGFEIASFGWAFAFGIIQSIIASFLFWVFK